jgi:predicted TIM-barrel fold metal-dependent hydrolase
VHVNPYPEDDIEALIAAIGADRVLWGSDYPHPEGIAEPLQNLPALQGLLSPDDFYKVTRGNAAALLGLED